MTIVSETAIVSCYADSAALLVMVLLLNSIRRVCGRAHQCSPALFRFPFPLRHALFVLRIICYNFIVNEVFEARV